MFFCGFVLFSIDLIMGLARQFCFVVVLVVVPVVAKPLLSLYTTKKNTKATHERQNHLQDHHNHLQDPHINSTSPLWGGRGWLCVRF